MSIKVETFRKSLADLSITSSAIDQIVSLTLEAEYESVRNEFKTLLTDAKPEEIEGIILKWLAGKQSASIETEKVEGIEPTIEDAVIKVVSFKLQPSYRSVDKVPVALPADRMNLNRSHFEIQGVTTDGKLLTFIAGYKQMYHQLGITPKPELIGEVSRDEKTRNDATEPVKNRIIGQFVIIRYNSFKKGVKYVVVDDSNPKGREHKPTTSGNHIVSLALDETGTFERNAAAIETNQLQRDTNNVAKELKVGTASELLDKLVSVKQQGLEFDAVEMLKALITA